MPTLSHSQMDTWQTCPMRWKLQTLDKAPETPQPAFFLGRAVHSAIEADNRARLLSGVGLSLPGLRRVAESTLTQEQQHHDLDGVLVAQLPTLAAKAAALLAAYARQVAGRFQPLLTEESFRLDLPAHEGWSFTGRIDALVSDATKRHLLVDYKTANRGWKYGEEHTRLQADAYLWAANQQSEWPKVEGVLFIPLIVTPTSEGFAGRAEVRTTQRSAEQLTGYGKLLGHTIDEIEACQESGEYPARPGWQCEYCSVAAACPVPPHLKGGRHANPVAPLQ